MGGRDVRVLAGGLVRHFPPRAPQNPAGHWSANRNRAAQARFRRHVLANAGHCCQYQGCAVTTELQAHHTQPGNHDPETGLALCRAHHKLIDPHAR
jgi:hypothetical protein